MRQVRGGLYIGRLGQALRGRSGKAKKVGEGRAKFCMFRADLRGRERGTYIRGELQ